MLRENINRNKWKLSQQLSRTWTKVRTNQFIRYRFAVFLKSLYFQVYDTEKDIMILQRDYRPGMMVAIKSIINEKEDKP